MHCKDCKYWKANSLYDGHVCDIVGMDERGEYNVLDNACGILYHVLDDSGLDCGLVTGPMFGCVNFKAKETNI